MMILRLNNGLVADQNQLSRVLKWSESIVRMYARLAANTGRAAQLERETVQLIRELRFRFLSPQARAPEPHGDLPHKLKLLLSFVRELPSEPLQKTWPHTLTGPEFLHSAYKEDNMSLVLQFLLAGSEEGRVDLITANFDYAHVKLLEMLHRTHNSIRVVCNSACYELFQNRLISDVTSVRPNLHCRLAVANRLAIVSSADMNADFSSHVEAGVIIETRQANPDMFVNTVLSGAIPLHDYRVGLNKARYRTSHLFLRLRHKGTTSMSSAMLPPSEISTEVYQILSSFGASGYVDSDDRQGMFFVNIVESNLNAQLVDEITSTCTREFHDWISIIPIESVIDVEERGHYVEKKVGGTQHMVLLCFSSDSTADSIARATTMESLARDANPSVRCNAISTDQGKIIYGGVGTSASEHYLCIVHQSGLVALSPIIDHNELEVRSIRRYLDLCDSMQSQTAG